MKTYHKTRSGYQSWYNPGNDLEFLEAYSTEQFTEEFGEAYDATKKDINLDCGGNTPLDEIFEMEGSLYACGFDKQGKIEVWQGHTVCDLDGYLYECEGSEND